MRSSKKQVLFRGLAVMALATLLLVGCNDSSPTEPKVVASIGWTGTFSGLSFPCDSSAQLSWQRADSDKGTMTVPCLGGAVLFFGGFQGNTFTGTAMWGDPEFYPLKGTLSGSSLEITIFNDSESGGNPMGQLHLHR